MEKISHTNVKSEDNMEVEQQSNDEMINEEDKEENF